MESESVTPIGVLRGPIKAGAEDDIYNRFVFGINKISDFCIPQPKRKEFREDYSAFFQNLLEAKYVMDICMSTIQTHIKDVQQGKDAVLSGHQINVNKPIDNEINIYFKDFFIRGAMAVEGLRKLLKKHFGYDITFLFIDDQKKFEEGAQEFKLDKNDPRFSALAEFIKSHRDGWYREFKKAREQIMHHGYKLPNLKYYLDKTGKPQVSFPLFEEYSIGTILETGWGNLSILCEEVLVFIMSLELPSPFVLKYVPEDKREKYFWVRYRVVHPSFPDAEFSTS